MPETIKIAGVQMDIRLGEVGQNLSRIGDHIQRAADAGAKLIVFPECALTGYCFDSKEEGMQVAEPIPGPSTAALTEVCQRTNTFAVVGMLERDRDRLFNACVLIGPKGVVGSYRKVHLPHLGIDRFTTPGDRPFQVFEAGPIRVAMNICYDCSFPEAARVLALQGADLVALPTNWPPGAKETADYVINTRAIENNIYYIAVNRVGVERGWSFIGKSRICHPTGRTLVAAEHENEEVLYAEVDPAVARNKHLVRVPKLHEIDRFKDRRPEMYGPVTAPKSESQTP